MAARDQKGAVAIEFTIVTLFILAPLLLGMIDLAIAIHNKQVITNASREGARAGIARAANPAAVAANYCAGRLIPSGTTPTFAVSGVGGVFQSDLIFIVSYEHSFMFGGFLGLGPITMAGRTVMKMERPSPS